ncbi:hypothetical protein KKG22_00190 [Patescibacteria group bacterium]|nr:hypothetical protein [Patescibacteria group bacterium]MBU1722095.1 hypothetical protein [Patescibacteria group bacterium]
MLSISLQHIFKLLNDAGILYVVMRHYDPIEQLNEQKDIDILVNPKQKKKLIKILKEFGFISRSFPTIDWRHEEYIYIDNIEKKIICFDIQTKLIFGKKRFFCLNKVETVLENRIKKENIYIPNKVDASVLFLYHRHLDKGDRQANVSMDELHEKRYVLQRNIHACIFTLHKIILLFKPVNLLVFIGVDGAGKSTLINKVKEEIPLFNTTVYLGWNNYFFSFCEKLSFPFFHLVLPFDMWFRYLRAKTLTKHQFLISDRYPLDPRLKFPNKKSLNFAMILRIFSYKLMMFLLPKPKGIIMLTGDLNILWERKKEGTYEKFICESERLDKTMAAFKYDSLIVRSDVDIKESMSVIINYCFPFILKKIKGKQFVFQYRKGNGFFIITAKHHVYKIAASYKGFKELFREYHKITCIKKDDFFISYLPKYVYRGIYSRTKRYIQIEDDKDKNSIIINYVTKAFQHKKDWPLQKIGDLLNKKDLLSFIEMYSLSELPFWNNILDMLKVPFSSAHGDCHRSNMLLNDSQLVLIDWGNYSNSSSRYFDLIDYCIITNSKQVWFAEFKAIIDNFRGDGKVDLFGVDVKKNIFFAYALWKISNELIAFPKKQEKYKEMLCALKELIRDEL